MSPNINGQPLDLLQAVYMEHYNPIIHYNLTLSGFIDMNRLKSAVKETCKLVPQLSYKFDVRKNAWLDNGYKIEDMVILNDESVDPLHMDWSLKEGPQLKIYVARGKMNDVLWIHMSHLVSDGGGFKEYIKLLSQLYSNKNLLSPEKNLRSISSIISKHKALSKTKKVKMPETVQCVNILSGKGYDNQYFLKEDIEIDSLHKIQSKMKDEHITINDIIITAFGLAVLKKSDLPAILLPCPINLRKHLEGAKRSYTIANFVGNITCKIERSEKENSLDALTKVHKEIAAQKTNLNYLRELKVLQKMYYILPVGLVKAVLRKFAPQSFMSSIAYTNLGVIYPNEINFGDIEVSESYFVGACRESPSFQISVSSYKDKCSLTCNFRGFHYEKVVINELIHDIKTQIDSWSSYHERL